MKGKLLSIFLIALLLIGCTAPKPEEIISKSKSELEIKPEDLLRLARDKGFNEEIIRALFENPVSNAELIVFYSQALAEHVNIDEELKRFADSLAAEIRIIGLVDENFLSNSSKVDEWLYKINHIIDVVNERFETNFPKIDLTQDEIRTARKILSYAPVLESYNKLYKASLKLPSNRDEDYWEFYKNLFLLLFDVAFVQGKVEYKVAFKSVWELIQILKLYKVQKVLGHKGYGLLLSEIHWSIRAEVGNIWKIRNVWSL